MEVGWWYAECCVHGLFQIIDEIELHILKGLLTERWYSGTLFKGAWPTKEEALAALGEPCAPEIR